MCLIQVFIILSALTSKTMPKPVKRKPASQKFVRRKRRKADEVPKCKVNVTLDNDTKNCTCYL